MLKKPTTQKKKKKETPRNQKQRKGNEVKKLPELRSPLERKRRDRTNWKKNRGPWRKGGQTASRLIQGEKRQNPHDKRYEERSIWYGENRPLSLTRRHERGRKKEAVGQQDNRENALFTHTTYRGCEMREGPK